MTLKTNRKIRISPDICVRIEHRARCPCVRIKHRAGCPTHSWVSAPYRGEEIQKWFDANMTLRTYRNIKILPNFCVRMKHRARCPCVRIKHRAGCPTHSWVSAPYRGEEIHKYLMQIWLWKQTEKSEYHLIFVSELNTAPGALVSE